MIELLAHLLKRFILLKWVISMISNFSIKSMLLEFFRNSSFVPSPSSICLFKVKCLQHPSDWCRCLTFRHYSPHEFSVSFIFERFSFLLDVTPTFFSVSVALPPRYIISHTRGFRFQPYSRRSANFVLNN